MVTGGSLGQAGGWYRLLLAKAMLTELRDQRREGQVWRVSVRECKAERVGRATLDQHAQASGHERCRVRVAMANMQQENVQCIAFCDCALVSAAGEAQCTDDEPIGKRQC